MTLTTEGEAQFIYFEAGMGGGSSQFAIDLVIMDAELEQAPTAIQVMVSGAYPGDELVFFIDAEEVYTVYAEGDGNLGMTSIPVPDDPPEIATAGMHTLKVVSPYSGEDEEDFTLSIGASEHPPGQTDDGDPVDTPGSVGRWVFQDLLPGGLGAWILEPSPTSMTNPHLQKLVAVEHTTAIYTGQFHITEAGLQTKDWSISGYCPDQAFHDQLTAFGELKRRIWVIDHRGRAWKVAITNVEFTPRKRQNDDVSPDNDWASGYKVNMLILDQQFTVPA